MITKKILIIDDDKDTLMILKKRLETVGFDVLTATDGMLGFQTALIEKPDLILLDIMMPTMDGFTTCKLFKDSPNVKDIPIVMISAKNQKEDVIKALDLGAKSYLIKPFNFQTALAKITDVIGVSPKELKEIQDRDSKIDEGLKRDTRRIEASRLIIEKEDEEKLAWLTIKQRKHGEIMVLDFFGQLKSEEESDAIEILTKIVEEETNKLLIDLSNLENFSWFDVDSLQTILNALAQKGAVIKLIADNDELYQIIIKRKFKFPVFQNKVETLKWFE